MYRTKGVNAVATISELRSKTTDLLSHVRERNEAVLIQRNNDPFAVLLDCETYETLMALRNEGQGEKESS